MKTHVEIMSRKAMNILIESGFPKNTAVISFYDPNGRRGLASSKEYKPINYNGICDSIFMVGVHDIDIEILGDYGLTYETYFPAVEKLADFIYTAVEHGMDIICQCEHGQSRSAACAAAIKEHFEKSGIFIDGLRDEHIEVDELIAPIIDKVSDIQLCFHKSKFESVHSILFTNFGWKFIPFFWHKRHEFAV